MVLRLLTAVASLFAELGALGTWASVVVSPGLSSSKACGILLDQGSNPCPLHRKIDSYSLDHHRSPRIYILKQTLGELFCTKFEEGCFIVNLFNFQHCGLLGSVKSSWWRAFYAL